ncbi:transcriptional regulator, AraC family [Cohaesibacter gelatinilyticus]|uniref:Transcriptional regulator, AraC family n=2 Tax=Cohaesibacter gelatinilyticus TaxID=372072 RepID=A0A285PCM4_9HYPH|nr:transcriptional regulator, AraC family [Cohaesibacter gelatinilyticus]
MFRLTYMADFTDENPSCVHRWSYTVEKDETSIVLPDGCLDILVVSCVETGKDMLCATHWDFSPRPVALRAGLTLTGYRLRPGTMVDLPELNAEVGNVSNLEAMINDAASPDQEITQIIEALGLPESSVDGLARQQGVSERSLQRHFKSLSLPPPVFWRQLGRARRAVQALPCRVPLSDIALDYGYSDQAHMTREFVRWFGLTPAQLRQSPDVMKYLAEPGLGNWS